MKGVDAPEAFAGFQAFTTYQSNKFAPSAGRNAMTSNYFVKLLNRGTNPACRTFPSTSRHIMRHIALINGS